MLNLMKMKFKGKKCIVIKIPDALFNVLFKPRTQSNSCTKYARAQEAANGGVSGSNPVPRE
jgi:hypothetical protein